MPWGPQVGSRPVLLGMALKLLQSEGQNGIFPPKGEARDRRMSRLPVTSLQRPRRGKGRGAAPVGILDHGERPRRLLAQVGWTVGHEKPNEGEKGKGQRPELCGSRLRRHRTIAHTRCADETPATSGPRITDGQAEAQNGQRTHRCQSPEWHWAKPREAGEGQRALGGSRG